jgi:hypothetical protein
VRLSLAGTADEVTLDVRQPVKAGENVFVAVDDAWIVPG